MKKFKKIIIGCGIFLAVLMIAGLYKVLLMDKLRDKVQTLRVGENSFTVDIADNAITQARGLSGRERLADGDGMLFVFSSLGERGFWMHGMKFSLDIVWISGNQIVGISENLPPAEFGETKVHYPPAPVDKVLEINAGLSKSLGLKIGDIVVLE